MNTQLQKHKLVLIDPEDQYSSFYPVLPSTSLFTIVPPPEESVAPQSVVESNHPTAGIELVEESTENFAEDIIEGVVEDTAEEITEY